MAENQDNKARIDVDVPDIPVNVHAQYVKDFSFENPNAPDILRPNNSRPNMDINITIDAVKIKDDENPNLYESAMTLTVKATRDDKTMFITEIVYAALVSIVDAPPERVNPILYVDLPQMMFPFARQMISSATGAGGFPPLMMNPIDFRSMYLSQKRDPNQAPKTAVN